MNKNIKISLSLLLLFALVLALCGCSAKAKGVTPLPGGCEIERIGGSECILSRRESEQTSCVLVGDYVYAYSVSDDGAYICVKALPYTVGLELGGDLSALGADELARQTLYYRVSVSDGAADSYGTAAQFDKALADGGITLSGWISTATPDG